MTVLPMAFLAVSGLPLWSPLDPRPCLRSFSVAAVLLGGLLLGPRATARRPFLGPLPLRGAAVGDCCDCETSVWEARWGFSQWGIWFVGAKGAGAGLEPTTFGSSTQHPNHSDTAAILNSNAWSPARRSECDEFQPAVARVPPRRRTQGARENA